MKTFSLKERDINKKWIVIDAEGLVLGRMSALIATRLRGKHKPEYTPHMDCGDNVIVVNAEKVALTGGNKARDMVFHWHTGYPGGLKQITAQKTLSGKFPERLVERSVRRMLPRTALGKNLISNLRVYAGSEHPHQAQSPEFFDVAALSSKNKKSG
jgi:large subunit ribosomal protein L13